MPAEPRVTVRLDDLTHDDVIALVQAHVGGMLRTSPPGHSFALAVDALRRPDVTFWTAWYDGALAGCGALKALGPDTGEIKSMRTREGFLRKGVAQAVLDAIVQAATARGYTSLFLETGTGEAFEASHRLYLRNGFAWCGPFGDYEASAFNVFMARRLREG